VETLGLDTQLEQGATPSKLSGETSSEAYKLRKENSIDLGEGVENTLPATMAEERGMDLPPITPMPPIPSIPPIDPLVKPRGLPIVISQNLAAMDMPSHLPKFYGTKDEDPSRHMERYIERLASSFVTNPGYWLVWFPTTLEGEAYEWYRDYAEGHFRG
jgi:hypothetical protein